MERFLKYDSGYMQVHDRLDPNDGSPIRQVYGEQAKKHSLPSI